MSRRRSTALLAVMLTLSGCSLRYVDGPPRVRPGAPVPETAECTTNYSMPLVDAIFGIASLFAIEEVWDDDDVETSFKVAMLAYPVGAFGSGLIGVRRIRACEDFLNTPVDAGPGPWLRHDRAPGWMFERGNGLERFFEQVPAIRD